MEQNSTTLNILQIFNIDERKQLIFLLNSDWAVAKKGEPHFRAFSLFLITLVGIAYANIQGWITIPQLNDPVIFGATVADGIIVYSIVIVISILNPDITTVFWEKLFDFLKIYKEKLNLRRWIISKGVYLVIIGGLLIVFWSIFFNLFPIVMLIWFVIPNVPLLLGNMTNNVIILSLLIIVLNFLIEFLALIFDINLVESIKNEKIWWLEKIKLEIELNNLSTENNNIQLERLYKKFDFSDFYIPIPIQRFFTFQKYVLFPRWIMKQWIDIEKCDEIDFTILKERFQSQKKVIYEKKAF